MELTPNPNKEERDKVAESIRRFRKLDRNGSYIKDRGLREYKRELPGLVDALKYTTSLSSNIVLDIGAGDGLAILDMDREFAGMNLEFRATMITDSEYYKSDTLQKKRKITSMEVLRGIEDASIGCVLSVFSMVYSMSPKLTVDSIDRVLVPGGIFKGIILTGYRYNYTKEHYNEEFLEEFFKKGYKVFKLPFYNSNIVSVMAFKPGGDKSRIEELSEGWIEITS